MVSSFLERIGARSGEGTVIPPSFNVDGGRGLSQTSHSSRQGCRVSVGILLALSSLTVSPLYFFTSLSISSSRIKKEDDK